MNKRFFLIGLVAAVMMLSCTNKETPVLAPTLTLAPVSATLKVGEMTTIEASGTATNIEWTSSDTTVATVFHGIVTAHAIGSTKIVATSGQTQAACQVFVSGADGATLRISPAFVSMQKGETFTFKIGNTYDLPLTWTSSNPEIATVDAQGKVTAVAPGNATITMKTDIEQVTALVAVAHKWGEYSLVWSDEFDGDKVDESVWNYNIGGNGWGNKESQYYTTRPENIRLVNGCLEIEARKEKYENCEYTSARIYSKGKKSFLYGKMEARIKFPGGKGTWPAFWMMGESGNWPKCGEIDIMEHVGAIDNRASFALHTQEKNGMNGKNWHGTHFFDNPLSNDFHVYGVEWCEEEENGKDCIRFTVDGEVYATVWENKIGDTVSWPFCQPHYFILNLAIGGTMGGSIDDAIFNQKRIMYVDWVRVYQRTEIND